jgi:hypothetical protein
VKKKMPTTGILNFLPDGSLNPQRLRYDTGFIYTAERWLCIGDLPSWLLKSAI